MVPFPTGQAWRKRTGPRRHRWVAGWLAADARGTAAIEAAIATPLLLLFLIGAIELGNVLYNATLVQTGLRDAARYLARVDDPVASEPLARNLAVTGTISGEAPPRVRWWATDDIAISYRITDNPPDPETGRRAFRAGDWVRVVRVATEIEYDGLGTLHVLGQELMRVRFAHEERVIGE